MSKVTFSMVVAILALVLKFVRAALRAVQVLIDLCDDGKVNGSADLPLWLSEIVKALEGIEATVSDTMSSVKECVDDSDVNGHA